MATQHTYCDALYDYTVFVVFIAGPVLICSGILKVVSMKVGWKWGWRQRAALGVSLGFVSLCVWAGQYFVRVRFPHTFSYCPESASHLPRLHMYLPRAHDMAHGG